MKSISRTKVYYVMTEKKVKTIFYLLDILFKLYGGFVGATLMLFFYSQGFDELLTNIIVSTSLITIFFAEIPAGAISDVFGRKLTVVLSGIALVIANLLFLFGSGFFRFHVGSTVRRDI